MKHINPFPAINTHLLKSQRLTVSLTTVYRSSVGRRERVVRVFLPRKKGESLGFQTLTAFKLEMGVTVKNITCNITLTVTCNITRNGLDILQIIVFHSNMNKIQPLEIDHGVKDFACGLFKYRMQWVLTDNLLEDSSTITLRAYSQNKRLKTSIAVADLSESIQANTVLLHDKTTRTWTGKWMDLNRLKVNENWQNKGLGTCIIDILLEFAREKRFALLVEASAYSGNRDNQLALRSFYQRQFHKVPGLDFFWFIPS